MHLASVRFACYNHNSLSQELVFVDDQAWCDAESLTHIFKIYENGFGGAHERCILLLTAFELGIRGTFVGPA
jgi:hypothetical protein